jgi:hypothetical protein
MSIKIDSSTGSVHLFLHDTNNIQSILVSIQSVIVGGS